MGIEEEIDLVGYAALYVRLASNIGSYHPEDMESAEDTIKELQFAIISRYGDEDGKKIIEEIRKFGNIKREY